MRVKNNINIFVNLVIWFKQLYHNLQCLSFDYLENKSLKFTNYVSFILNCSKKNAILMFFFKDKAMIQVLFLYFEFFLLFFNLFLL